MKNHQTLKKKKTLERHLQQQKHSSGRRTQVDCKQTQALPWPALQFCISVSCSSANPLAMACESCGLPYANHSFICFPVCAPHINNHGLFTLTSLFSATTTEPTIPLIFLRNLFRSMFCCLPTSLLHRSERQPYHPNRCTGDGILFFRLVHKFLSSLGIVSTFCNNSYGASQTLCVTASH